MNWQKLTQVEQLEEIKRQSFDRPVLLFKHSTRCSISSMSLDRLSRNWQPSDEEKVTPYFLDLISYRDLSNQVAMLFGIPHQSPQVILVKNGQVVYDNSHFGISYQEIMSKI
ncbi:MAG: bacillithiol system redox-active protein YtxJ [Algoriphagus sp.]|uniref:bacillithiol system redox-active protein YtxJ n=1 Tax=Algoriphagus sp. TaxID=1872435 RepID=UPI00181BB7D0|nr:bacillithiol system redox-active protein YtxJ [Algoriphagus sp.]NVJ87125.1 bacillithiol system redox-active protein YtxJ [Algoriphagus sp.]